MSEERSFFFVKSEYKIEKVLFKDVVLIEGMRDFRCIQTAERRILTSQTFTDLEEDLPASKFCRVHKSYMVALDKIEQIERNRIRIKDAFIPISETYKEDFYTRIGFGSAGKFKKI